MANTYHPRKRASALVFDGGSWWWWWQTTTTLENEHTCSCPRVVGGGGDGGRWWRCGGCHRHCPCWQRRQQQPFLSLLELGGGSWLLSRCRGQHRWQPRLQLSLSWSSVLRRVHIEICGCHCCQKKIKNEGSQTHLCARCPCVLLPCLRYVGEDGAC
jgi:hypothetical protein